jgi:hypothetical protein
MPWGVPHATTSQNGGGVGSVEPSRMPLLLTAPPVSISVRSISSESGSGPNLPDAARVVVVGGGVIGASITYHLGKLGWGDCTVMLERDRVTSGTTWHAAGLMVTMGYVYLCLCLVAAPAFAAASVSRTDSSPPPNWRRSLTTPYTDHHPAEAIISFESTSIPKQLSPISPYHSCTPSSLCTHCRSMSETSTELRKYTKELYGSLEAETGQSTGFKPCGFIQLASDPDHLEEYRRVPNQPRLSHARTHAHTHTLLQIPPD